MLLAGFYFRVDDFEKSKEIIRTKLPNQFDKVNIIDSFSNDHNIFIKIQKLNAILSSKVYNLINKDNSKINKSYSYQKILLEFSVFLEPNMDIAKYALAEIYNFEKTHETAIKLLDFISGESNRSFCLP